ncbi:cuticle collagen dpy-7 [Trichinella spiralis]|uniref:cuticle collagen dpy-7 n=1 Tax=Trichinella spiralis TaxID=6334 RepID=UPI0001EFDB7D|nr:cuticle collagen dpy-7 [Trichinella spiralis]
MFSSPELTQKKQNAVLSFVVRKMYTCVCFIGADARIWLNAISRIERISGQQSKHQSSHAFKLGQHDHHTPKTNHNVSGKPTPQCNHLIKQTNNEYRGIFSARTTQRTLHLALLNLKETEFIADQVDNRKGKRFRAQRHTIVCPKLI